MELSFAKNRRNIDSSWTKRIRGVRDEMAGALKTIDEQFRSKRLSLYQSHQQAAARAPRTQPAQVLGLEKTMERLVGQKNFRDAQFVKRLRDDKQREARQQEQKLQEQRLQLKMRELEKLRQRQREALRQKYELRVVEKEREKAAQLQNFQYFYRLQRQKTFHSHVGQFHQFEKALANKKVDKLDISIRCYKNKIRSSSLLNPCPSRRVSFL